jgi:hypothetical protein
MLDLPPSSLGAAADIVRWIWEEKTLDGRLRRIEVFLEKEGFELPRPPRGGWIVPKKGQSAWCMGSYELSLIRWLTREVARYTIKVMDHGQSIAV